jgi:hypothetical protein
MLARIDALPGFVPNDGSLLAELREQIHDEAARYVRRATHTERAHQCKAALAYKPGTPLFARACPAPPAINAPGRRGGSGRHTLLHAHERKHRSLPTMRHRSVQPPAQPQPRPHPVSGEFTSSRSTSAARTAASSMGRRRRAHGSRMGTCSVGGRNLSVLSCGTVPVRRVWLRHHDLPLKPTRWGSGSTRGGSDRPLND